MNNVTYTFYALNVDELQEMKNHINIDFPMCGVEIVNEVNTGQTFCIQCLGSVKSLIDISYNLGIIRRKHKELLVAKKTA